MTLRFYGTDLSQQSLDSGIMLCLLSLGIHESVCELERSRRKTTHNIYPFFHIYCLCCLDIS